MKHNRKNKRRGPCKRRGRHGCPECHGGALCRECDLDIKRKAFRQGGYDDPNEDGRCGHQITVKHL